MKQYATPQMNPGVWMEECVLRGQVTLSPVLVWQVLYQTLYQPSRYEPFPLFTLPTYVTILSGWAGEACETPIDECDSSPCLNGGICVDRHADYACACPFGKTLTSHDWWQKKEISNNYTYQALLIQETCSYSWRLPDATGNPCNRWNIQRNLTFPMSNRASTDNPSPDPCLHITALEGHSEIIISLNMPSWTWNRSQKIFWQNNHSITFTGTFFWQRLTL